MYNAHSKNISKQLLISVLMFIMNIVIFANGYYWHPILCLLPIGSIVLMLVLVIKERKKFDYKKPIVRIIALSIFLFLTVLGILTVEVGIDETYVSISSAFATITSYCHFVLTLISLIVVKRFEDKQLNIDKIDELDPIDGRKALVKSDKTLTIGWTSKKDSFITFLSFLLPFIILCLVSIFGWIEELSKTDSIILFVLVFVVLFFVFIIRANIISRPLREYENTFDYKKLEVTLKRVIDNPKVHIETRNYYKILLANYVGIASLEERKKILDEVFVPSFPAYRITYFVVKSLELNDDKEKLLDYYESIKKDHILNNKKYHNQVDKMIKQAKIVFGDLETNNFEKDFPIVYNTNMTKLNQKIMKLRYYFYRNDLENVKKLAEEIDKFLENIPNYPKKNIDKYLK